MVSLNTYTQTKRAQNSFAIYYWELAMSLSISLRIFDIHEASSLPVFCTVFYLYEICEDGFSIWFVAIADTRHSEETKQTQVMIADI